MPKGDIGLAHCHADGTQFGHMAGYYKLYSRAEIEQLVTYIHMQANRS